jgi:NADH:ubiquinone oxidoreductase subunit 3 (subunit A)
VSFFGLGGVVVFMAFLVVGLAYVWRKRAVGWE